MDNLFGINLQLLKLDYFRKFFYLVPSVPRQVNIEATNKCNLNCKMCKRKELGISEEDIDFEKFKQIIDQLPLGVNGVGVKEISFGSYGESFIHPQIYEMIAYVKQKGLDVAITTNGFTFLEAENRKKLLDSKMDALRVSIEAVQKRPSDAHPFSEKLLEAMGKLAQERNSVHSPLKLFFNTVVNLSNYDQIIDIIKYAEKIGFDQVELIHLDKKGNDIKEYLPLEKEIALYQEIKKQSQTGEIKIKVTSLYDRYLGIRKYAFRKMKYCPFTYDVCHITTDGDVTPCCFGLPRYKIDNIFEKNNITENSLLDIWNGSKFKEFRKNQEMVCNGCTLMKLK